MRVTRDSPIADKSRYLYQWETAARPYFNHFEMYKNTAREDLLRLFNNFLTNSRIFYVKGFKESTSLIGWIIYPLLLLYGVSVSIALYSRQHTQEIKNASNYLQANGAATYKLEKNQKNSSRTISLIVNTSNIYLNYMSLLTLYIYTADFHIIIK